MAQATERIIGRAYLLAKHIALGDVPELRARRAWARLAMRLCFDGVLNDRNTIINLAPAQTRAI